MIDKNQNANSQRRIVGRISNRSLFVVLGFILLLTALAGIRPLSYPDEGRYAEIGRWMVVSGDWLIPRLDGLPFFHKPPLLYWLEAVSFSTLGAHPWVARLTPMLHAGLMLVTLYMAMHHLATERLARRAAAMVGTSLAFLAAGQYVNHDMMVATWISIAIGSFAMALMSSGKASPWLARLGFVACGLGILSKGLIGIVFPGMVLLIWLVWTRQLKKIIYLPWFSGLTLLGLIALPWFIVTEQRFPGMLNYMFGLHHFQRFTGSAFNNNEPWWFYLASLVVLFFPWVFFSLAQLLSPIKSKQIAAAVTTPHSETSSLPPGLISLCWIWVVSIIGFFSIPAAKVIGYALPVIPPLAILAVAGWQQVMGHRSQERKLFIGICATNIVIALVLTIAVGQQTHKHSALDVGKTLTCLAKPQDALYVFDGFPYDLPFAANLKKPMLVVQDWATLRHTKSDNWHSELIDAADFDPEGAKVLQTTEQLGMAQKNSGNWLLAMSDSPHQDVLSSWHKIKQGTAWTLYSSTAKVNDPSQENCLKASLK